MISIYLLTNLLRARACQREREKRAIAITAQQIVLHNRAVSPKTRQFARESKTDQIQQKAKEKPCEKPPKNNIWEIIHI